jgi:hypothetical protein
VAPAYGCELSGHGPRALPRASPRYSRRVWNALRGGAEGLLVRAATREAHRAILWPSAQATESAVR